MRILVDLDGVLADFEKALYERWNGKYPNDPLVSPEKRTQFSIRKDHPGKDGLLREIYRAKGFFRSLPPVPGGIEAVREMVRMGHDVFVCTTPIVGSDYCIPEKMEWVKEHLGDDFVVRTIIARDKTLIKGDVLIDDHPGLKGLAEPEWELVIFDRPYNREIKNKKRITWDNWREALEL